MKKKMPLIVLGLIIILGLIIAGIYALKNREDKQIPPNTIDVSLDKNQNDEQINDEVSADTQSLVEAYIRENISKLSPEPAVLGGTFYVTSIQFTTPNSAIVEYEDGHIALRAQVDFSVSEENTVEIQNFIPLNEYLGCSDTCGNGSCEEIVCLASGCPCAETPASCPGDCK